MVVGMSHPPVAWDCDPGLQGKLLLRGRGEGAPSYGEEPARMVAGMSHPCSLGL